MTTATPERSIEIAWSDWNETTIKKCSHPGCKNAGLRLRTTSITSALGNKTRRHTFCAEHSPEPDVI